MLVFSITLTQKRVHPPVWIILVLHAELASVRALLVKGLDPSCLSSTLELECNVPSLLHALTQTKFRKYKHKLSQIHIDGTHTHTHAHTHTNTNTGPAALPSNSPMPGVFPEMEKDVRECDTPVSGGLRQADALA